MNVFGVGPAELIVILVVALLFVGPERLPKLAADLARTIREIRQYTGGIAAEFNEVIKDFEKDTEGERSQWKEIGEGITGAAKSVTDAIRDARLDAQGAPSVAGASAAATDSGPATVEAEWREIGEEPPTPPDAPSSAPSTNGHSPAPVPADEQR
jgi:sec-independent protein translocase protein TatB